MAVGQVYINWELAANTSAVEPLAQVRYQQKRVGEMNATVSPTSLIYTELLAGLHVGFAGASDGTSLGCPTRGHVGSTWGLGPTPALVSTL
jgi:hypothetical protein